jgi:hypothetical protein
MILSSKVKYTIPNLLCSDTDAFDAVSAEGRGH